MTGIFFGRTASNLCCVRVRIVAIMKLSLLLYFGAVVAALNEPESEIRIFPNDERLRFIGRFTQEAIPRFSWTGSQIRFAFDGSAKIYANFSGSPHGDRFVVIVDGNSQVFHRDFLVRGVGFRNYLVVDVQGVGAHTAVIWKATEDNARGASGEGTVHFGGLTVSEDNLSPAQPRASHRLEFIGDSDTAGWCADGEPLKAEYSWLWAAFSSLAFLATVGSLAAVIMTLSPIFQVGIVVLIVVAILVLFTSVFRISLVVLKIDRIDYASREWIVENSFESWASQLARALCGEDVEVFMQAISGSGVTRWPNIQQRRDFTLGFDERAGLWNYSHFTPEAVILLLGPNDDSLNEPDLVLTGYLSMLGSVVANYAPTLSAGEGLKIINVCGGSINGLDPCSVIRKAVQTFNADSARIQDGFQSYYVAISESNWNRVSLKFIMLPQTQPKGIKYLTFMCPFFDIL